MQEIVYHTNFLLEENYWWFVARNFIVKSLIKKKCNISHGDIILDAGCGTGGFAKILANDYQMLCLDTSEIALDYCRKRGLEHLFLTTIDGFPKSNWNVQAVTMLDVIEHIDDDVKTVADVSSIISKNGYFIVTVPAYQWMWSQHDELHMHKRRYTKKTITNLLITNGFSIDYASYLNFFLFLPAVLKRLIGSKIHKTNEIQSPVDKLPAFLNSLFRNVFKLEAYLLPLIRFPFGLSVIVIARKI